MGIRNIRAALEVPRAKVSNRARIVLVVMAMHALDRAGTNGAPPRVYFGGRHLILATLAEYPDAGAYRYVDRALSELAREGYIERLRTAAPGQPAVYWLRLPGVVDNRPVIGGEPVENHPPTGG